MVNYEMPLTRNWTVAMVARQRDLASGLAKLGCVGLRIRTCIELEGLAGLRPKPAAAAAIAHLCAALCSLVPA